MLSWLRFNTLIETLKQIPESCPIPLHLILRVQGMERLSSEDKEKVREAASGFSTTDIYFTRDNVGTAAARLDLIHRGAQQNYEYMMFTDDDIIFPAGGIEQQIQVLDKYDEIGSVSLKPGGIRKVQLVSEDGDVELSTYGLLSESLVEVYLVGSASIMFRSSLYTNHLIAPDPAYYIGTWDWDFVLQIRNIGYKVCVITDKEIINKRGGSNEYRKKRRNKRYVKENRRLFIKKWGFDPIKSRRVNSKFVRPVDVNNPLAINMELKKLEEELGPTKPDYQYRDNVQNISIKSGNDWRARIMNSKIKSLQVNC
jgi:GT2 family glycosyltransferase